MPVEKYRCNLQLGWPEVGDRGLMGVEWEMGGQEEPQSRAQSGVTKALCACILYSDIVTSPDSAREQEVGKRQDLKIEQRKRQRRGGSKVARSTPHSPCATGPLTWHRDALRAMKFIEMSH